MRAEREPGGVVAIVTRPAPWAGSPAGSPEWSFAGAKALVRGLLSDLPRKNCWTIAEQAGDATPDGMQHLPVNQ